MSGKLTEKWRLMRMDDHGNEYEMARFNDVAEAEKAKRVFEARGHKQTYYLKPAVPKGPA